MLTTRCDKDRNSKGKPFTAKTLCQHEEFCPVCTPPTKCGRKYSQQGNPFDTPQRMNDHEAQCPYCKAGVPFPKFRPRNDYDPYEELGLEMTDLIATGEENDGVFWGIAYELGEWV